MSGRTLSKTIGILGGLAALFLAGPQARAEGEPLRRLATLTVKGGYIDAHFAVSPNGHRLGLVHVGEGKTPTYLELYDLQGAKPRRLTKVEITKLTVAPVGLRFTPDSGRLMILSEMAARGTQRPKVAFVFDLGGKQVGKISPFSELAFRRTAKGWEIVTYYKNAAGARVFHDVSLYNVTTLRRTKTARITSAPNGDVAKPAMQIAFFSPDFAKVVVKVAGTYDRKRDVRLPDRQKVYDPFTRTFSADKEIGNLADWEGMKKIRVKHQRVPTLLQLSGTQKAPVFEMITPTHEKLALPDTNPPLKQFNFASLQQQNTDAPTVPFSLMVDPQWPTVFGDRRSVPEVLHVFLLDPATKAIKSLGSVAAPGQAIGWRLGGTRLAVMRLHRYWRLGDRAIEIYDVPAAK